MVLCLFLFCLFFYIWMGNCSVWWMLRYLPRMFCRAMPPKTCFAVFWRDVPEGQLRGVRQLHVTGRHPRCDTLKLQTENHYARLMLSLIRRSSKGGAISFIMWCNFCACSFIFWLWKASSNGPQWENSASHYIPCRSFFALFFSLRLHGRRNPADRGRQVHRAAPGARPQPPPTAVRRLPAVGACPGLMKPIDVLRGSKATTVCPPLLARDTASDLQVHHIFLYILIDKWFNIGWQVNLL